jgi:rod shape-determining protein MreD
VIELLKVVSITLVAVFIQLLLTKHLEYFYLLDIPLIAVVYFGTYKGRIESCIIGGIIGLIQDSISGLPLGMNGFSKTILGYVSASASRRLVLERFGMLLSLMLVLSLTDSTIKLVLFLGTGLTIPSRYAMATILQALLSTPPGAAAMVGLTKLDRWR